MSSTVSATDLSSVVANENRPIDAISFLGNDRWIIDDVTAKGGAGASDAAMAETSDRALMQNEKMLIASALNAEPMIAPMQEQVIAAVPEAEKSGDAAIQDNEDIEMLDAMLESVLD